MDFIKSEMEKEFSSIGFKNKRRNLKASSHQTGRTNTLVDESRNALLPGKRQSKVGKVYYEYRKNRTDKKGSRI